MNASATSLLKVEGASKSYGSAKALDDVTLGLGPGEFVALLGPNGAGKTTLFQLLTGLFVADRGRIVIDGLDIRRHLVTALARLGVVFQQPTLDLDLTVEANLRFHVRLHGLSRVAFGRLVRPGDQLAIRCERRSAEGAWVVDASATVDGQRVAAATLEYTLEPALPQTETARQAECLRAFARELQRSPGEATRAGDE